MLCTEAATDSSPRAVMIIPKIKDPIFSKLQKGIGAKMRYKITKLPLPLTRNQEAHANREDAPQNTQEARNIGIKQSHCRNENNEDDC